jgi:hypothetical protein
VIINFSSPQHLSHQYAFEQKKKSISVIVLPQAAFEGEALATAAPVDPLPSDGKDSGVWDLDLFIVFR